MWPDYHAGGACGSLAGMAAPVVKSATLDPRFKQMMADVKARDTWTAKLLAAGANKLYVAGNFTTTDRLTQLRRVATRLVLEDLCDGFSNAADVVSIVVGALSGLVERWGPGLRAEQRLQAVTKIDLSLKDALGQVATKDPAAAAALATWAAGSTADREQDANATNRKRFLQHLREGAAAPFTPADDSWKKYAAAAAAAGGLYLAWRLFRGR